MRFNNINIQFMKDLSAISIIAFLLLVTIVVITYTTGA
jgi:hypothetical protein